MKFKPSEEQAAVMRAIDNPSYAPNSYTPDSLIVDSKAGSGKTSLIQMCVENNRRIDAKSTVILAFNKKIERELSERRFAKLAKISTFHGYGFQMLRNAVLLNGAPDQKKIYSVIDELLLRGQVTVSQKIKYGKAAADTVRAAKVTGLVPDVMVDGKKWDHQMHGLLPDTPEMWMELTDTFDVVMPEEEFEENEFVEVCRKILARDIDATLSEGFFDFDDMIYIPVILNLKNWCAHPHIFIDEAQDLSLLRLHFISNQLAPQGRIIAVGDKNQAIYGFAGAHSNVFDFIRNQFSTKDFLLSVSRRCSKNVILAAQEFVPEIQSVPDAPDGQVLRMRTPWCPSDFTGGDMVLCRNNAPLIDLAFNMVEANVPFRILGVDLGKRLIRMIEQTKAHSIDELFIKLELWRDRQVAKAREHMREKLASRLDEQIGIIYIFSNKNSSGTPEQLCKIIKGFFSDDADAIDKRSVLLSTIHKAKGLEAPRAFILDSHLIGVKRDISEAQLQQEHNLHYVAITRAQNTLRYIDSSDLDMRGGAVGTQMQLV